MSDSDHDRPPPVGIIDYGSGNLLSVRYALERCGAEAALLTEPEHVYAMERIVLPGVGAYPAAMRRLVSAGLDTALAAHSWSGRPLLGICLGMQLLAEVGEEFGTTEGLGLIPGKVERMPAVDPQGRPTRIPFVGWAETRGAASSSAMMPPEAYYYYVHSYRFVPKDPDHVLASYRFYGDDVVAAVGQGATVGVQFHPERSGPAGLTFLEAFVHGRI